MLEERDRLMEKLRECQESYNESTKKLSVVEADNNILMRQLQALMPDVSVLPLVREEQYDLSAGSLFCLLQPWSMCKPCDFECGLSNDFAFAVVNLFHSYCMNSRHWVCFKENVFLLSPSNLSLSFPPSLPSFFSLSLSFSYLYLSFWSFFIHVSFFLSL